MIELDVNTERPTFDSSGRGGALDPSMLVPNGRQSTRRYLSPDERDFVAAFGRPGP